jgi:hypothetical protein
MVSLPGDVAPERFEGFYSQTAPARALMKRQYGDIPPQNFLQRNLGLLAGIPHPISKLRNIDGFMHATTNHASVQNAPAHLQMRRAAVARQIRDMDAVSSGAFKKAVAASALQQSLLAAEKKRRHENVKIHRSAAAGLKLKQALRQVTLNGNTKMQRETTRSAVRRLSDRKWRSNDLNDLLQKIVDPHAVDEHDLSVLAEADKKKNPSRSLDSTIPII